VVTIQGVNLWSLFSKPQYRVYVRAHTCIVTDIPLPEKAEEFDDALNNHELFKRISVLCSICKQRFQVLYQMLRKCNCRRNLKDASKIYVCYLRNVYVLVEKSESTDH
jgi:hypothetical protein